MKETEAGRLHVGMRFKAVGLAKANPGYGFVFDHGQARQERSVILTGTGGLFWSDDEDNAIKLELVKALSEAVWVVTTAKFSGGDRNFRDPWPDSWHVTAKTECGGEEYTILFVQAGTPGSNCYNSAMEVEVLT